MQNSDKDQARIDALLEGGFLFLVSIGIGVLFGAFEVHESSLAVWVSVSTVLGLVVAAGAFATHRFRREARAKEQLGYPLPERFRSIRLLWAATSLEGLVMLAVLVLRAHGAWAFAMAIGLVLLNILAIPALWVTQKARMLALVAAP